MAPQRRGAPKTPDGSGAAERLRPSSTRKDRAQQEAPRRGLKTAVLGACATLTALLLWSRMGGDDGVTEVLAHRMEVLPGRFIEVPCSEDYDSHRSFEGCTPRKCGRGISDVVISREEAVQIRSIAEKGLSLGGSDGGASILDLHSGALSVGKHFVNLYRYFGDKIQSVFSEEDFQLYRDVRQKVQLTIAEAFGISASLLYLTKPTFFSRINTTEARTAHDEYWHAHVDKVTYGSFDYTSLLYLSDYLEDFGGGRFVFMEEGANKTVEPRVEDLVVQWLKHSAANQRISCSNPPPVPHEKDVAACFREDYSLGNPMGQFHSVLWDRYELESTQQWPGLLLHLGVREPAPGGEGPLGHTLRHHHRLHLQPRPQHHRPYLHVASGALGMVLESCPRAPAQEQAHRGGFWTTLSAPCHLSPSHCTECLKG
ncbi:2-oxoglutarate and iron-dependent oxygenase domain-containing protein 3 isoform X2 [Loxodonta africana]|uniref:2-oxoglutarate and iron-dependent oxygenase domain-containing protein 3 isoform X2 n=1 Tax=Loxodonta africana TaxID=9785 RepID=UPI0030D39862